MKTILFEFAHQELAMYLGFCTNCSVPILSILQVNPLFQTRERLTSLYESKRPTAKKIINMLKAESPNNHWKQTFDHLKDYIRSLMELLPVSTSSHVPCIRSVRMHVNHKFCFLSRNR